MPIISQLPRVALENRSALPEISGIYFALTASDEVIYIGRAVNLRNRWAHGNHHRYRQLEKMGGIQIAYWDVPVDQLDRLERIAIQVHNPSLNATPVIQVDDVDRALFHMTEQFKDVCKLNRRLSIGLAERSNTITSLLNRIQNLEDEIEALKQPA